MTNLTKKFNQRINKRVRKSITNTFIDLTAKIHQSSLNTTDAHVLIERKADYAKLKICSYIDKLTELAKSDFL